METRRTAPKSYSHAYEALKSTDKQATNQSLHQVKKMSMMERTNMLQSETALNSRAEKAANQETARMVAREALEMVDNAIEQMKDNAINDVKRYEIASNLFENMMKNQVNVHFDTDLETKELVAKLIRKDTGDVIIQYPPEDALMLKRLAKYFPGAFLNTTA